MLSTVVLNTNRIFHYINKRACAFHSNKKSCLSMAAKRKYSAEDLQRAIAECRSKSEPNVHGVALKYGIPPSTLDGHVKGKVKKVGAGGSTVLSRQVEQEIVLSSLDTC